MKCGGISSPLASLTKPESIGCWINACTSVVSPLDVARIRMVDAIEFSLESAAAAADGDLDFLGRAIKLAASFHHRDYIAGLGHLQPVGDVRHGACGNPVGGCQRIGIFRNQDGD